MINESWGGPACLESDVAQFWPPIEAALRNQGIDSWGCVIGTLAAVGVMSPSFRPMTEIGDGDALERRYAGRPELGNVHPGDASRYRARGFTGMLGRSAYGRVGQRLGASLVEHPELAVDPDIAARALIDSFVERGLPYLADRGDWDAIRRIAGATDESWSRFMSMVRRFEALAAHRDSVRHARIRPGQVVERASDAFCADHGATGGAFAASIFAPEGTPVFSPCDGLSIPILERAGGYATSIVGDDGRTYYLAHGSTPFIGGTVKQGQLIGRVGSTGTGPGGYTSAGGTPPHLRYAIATNGPVSEGIGDVWIEPLAWGGERRRARRVG